MLTEIIARNNSVVIRRLVLEPGEAMLWHTDAYQRFTVVVRGERLCIEFQDSGEQWVVNIEPGMADWEAPGTRSHRTVNTGSSTYEEVATFYLEPVIHFAEE